MELRVRRGGRREKKRGEERKGEREGEIDTDLVSWLENFLSVTLARSCPNRITMRLASSGLELPAKTLMLDIFSFESNW